MSNDCSQNLDQQAHDVTNHLLRYLHNHAQNVVLRRKDDYDCVRIDEVVTSANQRRRRYVTLRSGHTSSDVTTSHTTTASRTIETTERVEEVTSRTVGYNMHLRVHLQLEISRKENGNIWSTSVHETKSKLRKIYNRVDRWMQRMRNRNMLTSDASLGDAAMTSEATSTSDVVGCWREGCFESWAVAEIKVNCDNSFLNSTLLQCGKFNLLPEL